MKVKTSELEGVALDWAVAVTQGWQPDGSRGDLQKTTMVRAVEIKSLLFPGKHLDQGGMPEPRSYSPSTDWSQGGPLIDRLISNLIDLLGDWYAEASEGMYGKPLEEFDGKGPTPLIASMRAIVAAELGDEVDVPEELVS